MKVITRLLVVVFVLVSVCYYFDIDMKGVLNSFSNIIASKDLQPPGSGSADINKEDRGIATMPDSTVTETVDEDMDTYNEIIKFLKNQKKEKKLIESYRVLDKTIGGYLKDRSYINDNGIAVIALINNKDDESEGIAVDILKNLKSIQNEDGSWYDFYDTSGQTVKVSGKDYKECNTGNNAVVLYAYSYYTIMTGDRQFNETMKRSAGFILSRMDNKTGCIYDQSVSEKGLRTVKTNIYSYFGIREYALSNAAENYREYKNKLDAADKIGAWVLSDCIDKGTFIKGYSGKDKIISQDLDSQVLGFIFARSIDVEKNMKFESKKLEDVLSKLYKNISSMEGYRMDGESKNNGFIWCEGTGKAAIALLKLENMERARNMLDFIEKYNNIVSKSLSPRGIPYSTNVDNKIDAINLESISSSAWAAIAYQSYSNNQVNSIFMGREEDVFKKTR